MNSIRTATKQQASIHVGADLSEEVQNEDPMEQHMHYVNSEKNIVQKIRFHFRRKNHSTLKRQLGTKRGQQIIRIFHAVLTWRLHPGSLLGSQVW